MAAAIDITENEVTAEEWDAYINAHPAATFFHQYHWLTLIKKVYGGTPHYLTAYESGRTVGVLPLMQRRVLGAGQILVSVPFADEGGLIADGLVPQARLLEAAGLLAVKTRTRYVELRQLVSIDDALLTDASRVTLKLQLPRSSDELWQSLPAKVRNQVRKAERCGLTAARVDNLGCGVEQSFYPVYSRNTRDLGSPMHAASFFHSLVELFPNRAQVFKVTLGMDPVGAALVVCHDGVFSVPWASSLRTHFQMCPNNLLYWAMMKAAVEQGYSTFDFGRSPRHSGTLNFKRQWGPKELQLHYSFLCATGKPEIADKRESRAYQLFARIWQRTPMPIARALGPKIFARLPL